MRILVTGSAGFIGLFVAKQLLELGHNVVGIDNINNYYDPNLKKARLGVLKEYQNFKFVKADLIDLEDMHAIFQNEQFDVVINLAAQAGVRYSLENPYIYIDSNVKGFMNILECCKEYAIKHLVYASSSSVYGNSKESPFKIEQRVDNPVSIYAATKKMNELMAHTYSYLYKIPTTGLRFFTVYGPWGRPDMAPFLFTKAILDSRPIKIFNNGDLERDFTYVDDIAEGVCRIINCIPSCQDNIPYAVYNIGNANPIKLMDFITILEKELGIEAQKEFLPMQKGDVYSTYADVTSLQEAISYHPTTKLEDGIRKFVSWYKMFNNIK